MTISKLMAYTPWLIPYMLVFINVRRVSLYYITNFRNGHETHYFIGNKFGLLRPINKQLYNRLKGDGYQLSFCYDSYSNIKYNIVPINAYFQTSMNNFGDTSFPTLFLVRIHVYVYTDDHNKHISRGHALCLHIHPVVHTIPVSYACVMPYHFFRRITRHLDWWKYIVTRLVSCLMLPWQKESYIIYYNYEESQLHLCEIEINCTLRLKRKVLDC